ncbi:right-handed parallel beta-helix repeat-containing protein [Candidatus Eisenbacteria bacterium]|uniref:Right-handed parallel beta-helix repeat-containing protein n=1 Tax=Eiseniibacteriota bacterium TaxID=2212470 RepID=A0ABV6YIB1_UNCEI
MRALVLLLLCGGILSAVGMTSADTHTVRPDGTGDYATIQAAIDASVDGDIIELTDGIFAGDGNRDIDYLGKAITVRSQSGGAEDCFIDCEGSETTPRRAFHFHSGEQDNSRLSGVTIKHGWAPIESRGGGIRCEAGSAPVVIDCILTENSGAAALCVGQSWLTFINCRFISNSAFEGGGICCEEATLTTLHCTFSNNTAVQHGGGIHAHAAVVEMEDCIFVQNTAAHGGATDFHVGSQVEVRDCLYVENSATEAGCLCLFAGCQGTIERCTFVGNSSDHWAAALSVGKTTTAHVAGCTFYANAAPGGALILSDDPSTVTNTIVAFTISGPAFYSWSNVTLSCCDLYGNEGGDWIGGYAGQYGINGNIAEDPLFCDPGSGDFTLHELSPCAPFSPPNPECDLIGAWPVACGGTPVTPTTWGTIKAMFK